MEAISHAGTALAIQAKDGIILAAEKRTTSKLLEQTKSTEKIYVLNDNMLAAVAGLTSDANTLISYCRNAAQRYLMSYGEPIPCEQLTQRLCDLKQGYTQYGGMRPFGVSFLYAGWDKYHGFQLYHSDPSGNYFGWKAHCIGANNATAQSILKSDYKEDMDLKEVVALSVKILSKTMETTHLTADKLEFAMLKLDENGKFFYKLLSQSEIETVIKENQASIASSSSAATE